MFCNIVLNVDDNKCCILVHISSVLRAVDFFDFGYID